SRMIFNHAGYIYGDETDALPDGDYSVYASINAKTDTTSSIVSSLLLQSELKGVIEDPDYYFRQRDSITDSHLDLLLLTQGWERYDLNSALHNEYAKPELPMEIGGEISGTVKSRWKGKPLKNAVVMLISPKLNFADQSTTDSDGRFVFKGLDWPDHTAFTIQVLGKNGNKEHNFSVDEEEDPQISPIPEILELNDPDALVDYDLLTAGTVMLEELVVTAPMGSEQARREMLAALGVKSFTSKEMEDKHMTSYEEVLRKIPGLRIVNGNVVSSFSRASTYNSGGVGTPVEYWVDGVLWTPSAIASGSLGQSNSPELMNSPMSSEHSYSVSMNNTLKEFEGTYPIHIVETIEYYRPSAAMVISQSAAHGGGALVVTTKEGNQSREWDADLFIRSFKPLGYQNRPEAYKPHYTYDPTSYDGAYRAAWLPKVTNAASLPDGEDLFLKVEGIANGYMPVLIRKNPKHQND
ncbi:MAG: TonB-dependent receptor plug domain-containing protein, partial [Muribaculaceae bacterium]|nr:TonB-dependent receptor plug domain-containing protein [Muribaculaceae bacterium]